LGLFVTLTINDPQHNNTALSAIVLSVINAECCLSFTVMLNAIMLSVVMLNVIMLNVVMLNVIILNVIMLNVIMLSVIAPP
jgi:hypothetical protein